MNQINAEQKRRAIIGLRMYLPSMLRPIITRWKRIEAAVLYGTRGKPLPHRALISDVLVNAATAAHCLHPP